MAYQNAGVGPKTRFSTEEGECPICRTEYENVEEVAHKEKADLPGIVYEHDGFWCGEFADGEKVEGGFERNNPTNE